jgi:hypothetical protein
MVVNIKDDKFEIYIGRGTKWGNPFIIGKDGNRKEVIEKYEMWIRTEPQLIACLGELEGKILGCHCKPKACHGDILEQLIEVKKYVD